MKFLVNWLLKNGRSIILILAIVLVCGVLLESSPYLIYPVLRGKQFLPNELQDRLLSAQEEVQVAQNKLERINPQLHVLHPYLGFVYGYQSGSTKVNNYGFHGQQPILKKSDDKIIIGLTGGSFALGLYSDAKTALIDRLKKQPEFSGKDVEIISFALGGYKQPQQLMALNYFLYLGAEFDVIINLDGFNEVALTYEDNILHNINPFFPRAWDVYARKSFDTESIWQVARIRQIQSERVELNRFFTRFLFRYSNFCLAIWDILDIQKQEVYFLANIELDQILLKSERNYQKTGPDFEYDTEKDLFINLTMKWYQGSAIMSEICKSSKIAYFHFIQPNQYYESSKILSNEEEKILHDGNLADYKKGVTIGYPLLRKAGEMLINRGVNFTDLTMMFKNDKRTLYKDACCHLNQLGYSEVAKEIANTINRGYIKENTDSNSQTMGDLELLHNVLMDIEK